MSSIESIDGRINAANQPGRCRAGLEMRRVSGGELEIVEKSRGAFALQMSGSQSIDYEEEGHLNGFQVLEGMELDVLAGDETIPAVFGVPISGCGAGATGYERSTIGSQSR